MAARACRSVKRFGLGAIRAAFAAFIACPAMAEDKAASLYTPPGLGPVATWTGFYVGANVGANWNNDKTIISSNPTFASILLQTLPPFFTAMFNAYTPSGNGALPANSSGQFVGGGQIGYNYQLARLVLGIEADIQSGSHSTASRVNSTTASFLFSSSNVVSSLTAQSSLDYLGTVRGRIGGLVTPTLLAYGTGGLAYGHVHSAVDIVQTAVGTGQNAGQFLVTPGSGGVFSQMRTGWTIGGGIEWMFVPNWMAKVEYLHYDLGSVSYGAGTRTTVLGGVPGPAWTLVSNTTTRFSGDVVRVGVNYKFGDVW
jgi:outer membrane immunogenic protein